MTLKRRASDKELLDELRVKTADLIGKDPKKAATILTSWVQTPKKSAQTKVVPLKSHIQTRKKQAA